MRYCRWSPTLGEGFERTPYEAWGVEKYDPEKHINEPTVFCGVYGLPDFYALWGHKGKKWVWWAGSDIRHLQKGYFLDNGKIRLSNKEISQWLNKYCENWCENRVEQDALKELGIKSKVAPSFLGDVDNFLKRESIGKRYYSSVSGDDFELYGWDRVNKLAKTTPDTEYYLYGNTKPWKASKNVIVRGRIPVEQMNEETKTMTGVIRFVRFEGFSEIVCKAILWGQQVISDIEYDYTRESLLKVLNRYPWNNRRLTKDI